MLGIQINGRFVDLSPGTRAQLERQSPFFNADDLAGEYSLPFTFPYTPNNALLFGLQNHYYTRRVKKKISDVKLFDRNNFTYSGELIISAVDLHLNDIGKSKISGYFLTGVSSFFQSVKGKKLKELSLGGERNFVWTNSDPASVNKGFWQHIHDTLAGTKEYSFAPIRNELWSGNKEDGSADWMNKLDANGHIDFDNNFNTLAPQISLKYLLEQIFEEHNWTLDYSGMTDLQWQTLFMPSFYSVTWQTVREVGAGFEYTPMANIKINLQNHVPPEETISGFILAIVKRFNWGLDFNSSKKICRLFALKDIANGKKKNWTPYMSALWKSDFSEEEKLFAFRNEIDGGDAFSSGQDLTKVTLGEPVEYSEDLPAAAEENLNLVVFCWKENRYYQSSYNEEDTEYHWAVYADNIYDYEPLGYNAEITTTASTMPVYKTLYRNNGITDYYGLFPMCEQEGNWEGKKGEFKPWGIRLLFHRGYVWEGNSLNNKGQIKYPYLTSICFTITQEEPDLLWSNVWKHQVLDFDKGIWEFWYKESMQYLVQAEIMTGVLNIPRHELISFSWTDVIILKNIPFVVQDMNDVIPYDGSVPVKVRRIG